MTISKDTAKFAVKIVDGNGNVIGTATTPGVVMASKTFSTATATFGRHSTNTTFPAVPEALAKKLTIVGMNINATGATSLALNNVTGLTTTSQVIGNLSFAASEQKRWEQTSFPEAYWYQGATGHKLQGKVSSTDTTIEMSVIYYSTA